MKTKHQLFIHLFLIISSLILFSSCDEIIIGSGKVVKESRHVNSFKAIDISGSFKIFLSQGDNESLMIEADDNLMKYIKSHVSGGTLYLETTGYNLKSTTLKAYITIKELNNIEASGAVKITGEAPLDIDDLSIGVSGAANLNMELYGDKLELKVSGAGKGSMKGNIDKAIIKLSGASKLLAEELIVNNMDIEISGAGSAKVNVINELDASISGAGNIRYAGNPKVHSNISGAGKVKKIE